MPCISREESPENLGLSFFQDSTELGKSQKKEELDPKCASWGPQREWSLPGDFWAGEADSLHRNTISRTRWVNHQALFWGVPGSCSDSLLLAYPWCLLRDDKSIRPHEQSFIRRRSSRTSRECHQSCAGSELRASEWTRPLLSPAPSL